MAINPTEVALARWHRTVSAVCGDINAALTRRRLRPSDPAEWVAHLRRLADEMEATALSLLPGEPGGG